MNWEMISPRYRMGYVQPPFVSTANIEHEYLLILFQVYERRLGNGNTTHEVGRYQISNGIQHCTET